MLDAAMLGNAMNDKRHLQDFTKRKMSGAFYFGRKLFSAEDILNYQTTENIGFPSIMCKIHKCETRVRVPFWIYIFIHPKYM